MPCFQDSGEPGRGRKIWFLKVLLYVLTIANQVSNARTSSEACCKDKNLLSCRDAMVNPEILDTKEDIRLADVVVSFKSTVSPNGYVYQSPAGDEAVITFNKKTGNMFGSFKTTSGRSFAIEKCSSGHTWREFNVNSFKADSAVDLGVKEATSRKVSELRKSGAEDTTTPASYSVMFYYTADFEAITSDIPGYIDQVLAETNQGYANSQLPLTVTRFCIEAATINDIQDTSDFISAFANMKPTTAELRNTADAAALLSVDFNSCGVAYLNTWDSGWTISVCQKSCALGYFSFGHELGHNMGLMHNKESSTNSYYAYGHGHLIQRGSASTGYRTILAYSASGHSQRVNYYSHPGMTYAPTGTSLGEDGVADNARVLMENRLAMQAVGDESGTCSDGSSPPTSAPTSAPTTAAPGSGSGGSASCGNCVFPFTFAGRVHTTCTTIDGDPRPWCSTKVDSSGVHVSGGGHWEYCTSDSCPGVNPPEMCVHPSNNVGSCCKLKCTSIIEIKALPIQLVEFQTQ